MSLCFLQIYVMEGHGCRESSQQRKHQSPLGANSFPCLPHPICLKVKIAQVFFHVFAVFHHPDAGKSAYKQVQKPLLLFLIQFICRRRRLCVYAFVYLRLDLCLFCEYAHVVQCWRNSRRHLSRWLCTIIADCIFLFIFFLPEMFPCITVPSPRHTLSLKASPVSL